MDARLEASLAAALGSRVMTARPLAGGDINEAFEVALADGRPRVREDAMFAHPMTCSPRRRGGSPGWRDARALRVPAVLAASGARRADAVPRARADRGRRRARATSTSGWAAGWRRCTAMARPAFGLDHDNFIGRLPQKNTHARHLARVLPGAAPRPAAAARRRRRAGAGAHAAAASSACSRQLRDARAGRPSRRRACTAICGAATSSADDAGEPCLIDPAVYGGHREIDLAMMRLFGGFGARVFAAYKEAFPLADGHQERVALYQLYPLMVHVNLFGGGYVGSVESALARLC